MISRYLRLLVLLAVTSLAGPFTQTAQAQEALALFLTDGANQDNATLKTVLDLGGYSIIDPGVANRDGIAWAVDVFTRKLSRSGPDSIGIVYVELPAVTVAGKSYLLPPRALLTGADITADGYLIDDLLNALSALNGSNIGLILDACQGVGQAPGQEKKTDGTEYDFSAPLPHVPGVMVADCRSPDGARDPAMAQTFLDSMTVPDQTLGQVFDKADRGGPAAALVQVPQNQAQTQPATQAPAQTEATAQAPQQSPPADTSLEGLVWNVVRISEDEAVLEDFLNRFPDSIHAEEVRSKLAELRNPPVTASAPVTETAPQKTETASAPEPAPESAPKSTPELGQKLAVQPNLQAANRKAQNTGSQGTGSQTTAALDRNRFTATLSGTDATGWGNLYRHDCGSAVGYRMTMRMEADAWKADLVRETDGKTMTFTQRDRTRKDGVVLLQAHDEGAKVTLKVRPGRSEKATYSIPTAGIGSCAVGYLY